MVDVLPPGLRMFDISGRSALVTGGASGLGFAISRVLARNGARVVMVDAAADTLEAAVAELVTEGQDVRGVVADVTDAAAISQAVATAAEGGRLDIAFANAGISSGRGRHFGTGLLADIDQDRWDAVLRVNVAGALHTVRAAAAAMGAGGRIVLTSSIAGHRADPLVGYAYSTSKAALSHLGRGLADELAPRGINVNVIAPGAFLTPIGAANPGNQEMLRELADSTATGRVADPSEIEGLALLLASPAASHICGAVIAIDGGTLVHHR